MADEPVVPGAAPEPAANALEGAANPVETASAEGQDAAQPEERTYTEAEHKAELEKALQKRLAREQRKYEREAEELRQIALRSQQQTQPKPEQAQAQPADARPQREQFADYESYVEALADWKADQRFSARERERQQQEAFRRAQTEQLSVAQAHKEREAKFVASVEDYQEKVNNPNLRISDVMAQAILHSELGPQVAYYLGNNPDEAERIAALPPIAAVKEIGKLETKVATPTKPKSSAPPPIEPIKRGSASNAIDTTDPKSLERLGTSAWIAAERERQMRKAGARH